MDNTSFQDLPPVQRVTSTNSSSDTAVREEGSCSLKSQEHGFFKMMLLYCRSIIMILLFPVVPFLGVTIRGYHGIKLRLRKFWIEDLYEGKILYVIRLLPFIVVGPEAEANTEIVESPEQVPTELTSDGLIVRIKILVSKIVEWGQRIAQIVFSFGLSQLVLQYAENGLKRLGKNLNLVLYIQALYIRSVRHFVRRLRVLGLSRFAHSEDATEKPNGLGVPVQDDPVQKRQHKRKRSQLTDLVGDLSDYNSEQDSDYEPGNDNVDSEDEDHSGDEAVTLEEVSDLIKAQQDPLPDLSALTEPLEAANETTYQADVSRFVTEESELSVSTAEEASDSDGHRTSK